MGGDGNVNPPPGLKIITQDNISELISGNYLVFVGKNAASIYRLVVDNNIVTAAELQQDSETVWGADITVTYSELMDIPLEYQVGTIRPLSLAEVYTKMEDVKRIIKSNSNLTVNESHPIIMENAPEINGILSGSRSK